MDSVTIFVAKYVILVPVLAIAYLFYKSSKRRELVFLLIVGGILSVILSRIASRLYWDPRPFLRDGVTPLFTASRDNGFPSDHTLLAAFLGYVAIDYSRKLGWALLVVAALIGWARVAAGVHHGIDITASFAITGLAYIIAAHLMKMKLAQPKAQPKPKKAPTKHKTSPKKG